MKRKLWIMLALAALILALTCGAALAAIRMEPLNDEGTVYYENDGSGAIRIGGTGATKDYNTAYNISPLDGNSMTAVEIGAGVTYIGNNVLINCENLISVTINNPNAVISGTAIRFSNANITIYGWEGSTAQTYAQGEGYTFQSLGSLTGSCGANVTYSFDPATGEMTISGTGAMADYNSDDTPWYTYRNRITSLSIGNGVTHIGKYAFYGCDSMTDVIIPVSVTSIGYYSFCACSGLTDIMIPDNVTSIDSFAFYSCDSLTSITIPAKVTNIASYAFYSCDSLTNVTINNPATNIGTNAFKYCSPSLTIYGWTGSTAETYANDNSIPFVSIGSTGSCGDSVTYSFDRSTGTLTISGTGYMTTFLYDSLAPWNGYKDDILSVIIDNGVAGIGQLSFYQCTNLVSVTIPDTVKDIGANAFNGCTSLNNIAIPASVTRIGGGAFTGCTALTGISIPNSVKTINMNAFSYSGLTSVDIPSSVTAVDSYAFFYCQNLTSATIRNPETSIGEDVFSSSSSLVLHGWAGSTAQTYAQNAGITFEAFATAGSCGDNLTWSFDPVTGALTISGTGNMTGFGSPDEVPWYDYRQNITSVSIGDGVPSVGKRAFWGCAGLTSVTLPASVADIGFWAFRDCTGLTEVTVQNPDCVIGDSDHDVFQGCNTPVLKGWPGSTAETYASDSRSNVTFQSLGALSGSCGENVTWAFNPATGALTISGTGTMTNYSAYYDVPWYKFEDSITSVSIVNGVTSIGQCAFIGCNNLISVTIPNGVTTIGCDAFYDCTSLSGVTIPNSMTSIGDSAFWDCVSLTSISIPNSVTYIGNMAFKDCGNLTSAVVLNADTTFGTNVFRAVSTFPRFTLHGWAGSTAEAYARDNNHSFEPLAPAPDFFLPADLTSIESEAFSGIAAQAVVIPKGIQSISPNAFADSDVLYIYGFPGTAAQTLAESDPIRFMFFPLTDAWYARLTN